MNASPLDRHEKIALSFSGGKDSLACVYLLRDRLDALTIYHLDTGDLMPETREVVAHVRSFAPNFVTIDRDVAAWQAEFGLPSDLVPHSAHQVGQAMGEGSTRLVHRYDCCYLNLMLPLFSRMLKDGCTLVIRGTRRVDMKRLPAATGDHVDGVEIYYPLENWTTAQVFAFLQLRDAPISRVYEMLHGSPDCALCTAWWNEHRGAYLKKYHPGLWQEYDRRLQLVINEIAGPLSALKREAEIR